jgi:hypothetical protein
MNYEFFYLFYPFHLFYLITKSPSSPLPALHAAAFPLQKQPATRKERIWFLPLLNAPNLVPGALIEVVLRVDAATRIEGQDVCGGITSFSSRPVGSVRTLLIDPRTESHAAVYTTPRSNIICRNIRCTRITVRPSATAKALIEIYEISLRRHSPRRRAQRICICRVRIFTHTLPII